MPPRVTSLPVKKSFPGLTVVFMIGGVFKMTDEEVLMKIIELHPRMFAYALGILRDRQKAEDALQEAEIAVWRVRKRVDNPEVLAERTFPMLRNTISDHFR
jgi:DNA-directed RNA polymerase specialized sigma24 family protein